MREAKYGDKVVYTPSAEKWNDIRYDAKVIAHYNDNCCDLDVNIDGIPSTITHVPYNSEGIVMNSWGYPEEIDGTIQSTEDC